MRVKKSRTDVMNSVFVNSLRLYIKISCRCYVTLFPLTWLWKDQKGKTNLNINPTENSFFLKVSCRILNLIAIEKLQKKPTYVCIGKLKINSSYFVFAFNIDKCLISFLINSQLHLYYLIFLKDKAKIKKTCLLNAALLDYI